MELPDTMVPQVPLEISLKVMTKGAHNIAQDQILPHEYGAVLGLDSHLFFKHG